MLKLGLFNCKNVPQKKTTLRDPDRKVNLHIMYQKSDNPPIIYIIGFLKPTNQYQYLHLKKYWFKEQNNKSLN